MVHSVAVTASTKTATASEAVPIPNARAYANNVAQAITAHSYRHDQNGESYSRVCDIILYGRTVWSPRNARDIDLLIVHKLPSLDRFGVYTFNRVRAHAVNGAAVQASQPFPATAYLEKMGTPQIPDYVAFLAALQRFESEAPNFESDLVRFKFGPVFREMRKRDIETVIAALRGEYDPQRAVAAVRTVAARHGQDLNATLDVHIIRQEMLLSREVRWEAQRRRAIHEAGDRKFWHEIVTTGIMYDARKKRFAQPVERTYCHAAQLMRA